MLSCDSCLNEEVLSDCIGTAWVHGRKGVLTYLNFHFHILFISFSHLIKGEEVIASDKCIGYRITSFLFFVCLFLSRKVRKCISPTLSVS